MRKIFLLIIILVTMTTGCTGHKIIDLRANPEQQPDSAFLSIPIELDIVHLDKRKINIITLYEEYVTYKVTPGTHLIGLQYNNLVENNDGDKETIKSAIVQLKFNAEKNKTYTVRYKKPNTFTEAVALSKSLKLSLYSDAKLVATSEANDLWQISDAIEKSMDSNTTFDSSTDKTQKMPAANDTPDKQLIYWWNQANNSQKQRFLQMIQE